ncbi:MAG: hypothetical protein QNJ54_20620 [Prochloraceae cyanobacterium]|nr:hypothetical protein [Prochloraceae cyanobacterium]
MDNNDDRSRLSAYPIVLKFGRSPPATNMALIWKIIAINSYLG